jgi:tRNA (cmo5U34)-methyltransferase
MSVCFESGNVVHYPSNPEKFSFDGEVAAIFPDMALRSIPMYHEVHRMHVSLLSSVWQRSAVKVVDVGASRGGFFKEICNQLHVPTYSGSPNLDFIAVDCSGPMLGLLKSEMPWVQTVHARAEELEPLEGKADVICMLYVLQFVKEPLDKLRILHWAASSLKPGGVLLLGQKDVTTETYGGMFTEEYYRFRERNGYTRDEIVAKTRALRNSMWPSTPAWLEDMCVQAGFVDYAETTRWLQFSTSICTVGG